MPRSLVHILLSLLLLVSQQLALGHAYTHWHDGRTAQAAAGQDGEGKNSKPAVHDLCGQCAASATISFALPPTVRRFAPAEFAYAKPVADAASGVRLLAASAFQPRGPPRA
jgi:hypothetical protein